MKEGIIYKALNTITNMTYIGATTKSLDERKQDHVHKAEINNECKFHQAISTYGINSFLWEQVDTASTMDELAEKEIKYIQESDSLIKGYNSDKGGGFKKTVYRYNFDGSLNLTFSNLTDAGNSINVRKQDISRACWSANHLLGGFLWSYKYNEPFIVEHDKRHKKVTQYALNGEEFANYTSASEASRITGISKTCITRCCRGEREQTGGFFWEYI